MQRHTWSDQNNDLDRLSLRYRSTYFCGHVMCILALLLCRDKKSQLQQCDGDTAKKKDNVFTAAGLPYVSSVELKWIWIKFMSAVCGTLPLVERQK